MRNSLPKKIRKRECGIVNLDNSENNGTHWTAYIKKGENIIYFDSYGNLTPDLKLVKYFKSDSTRNKISYNYDKYQSYDTTDCGKLCLVFLHNHMYMFG
jgi:hypothetical protein